MTDDSRGWRTAWLVLLVVSLANFGNYYVYDSIGPVADLLHRQRGFTDSQIGMLNAIYSLPNIMLLLFGGMLVDRFGAARMMFWTGFVCLVGAALTAFSPDFRSMAAGRLLFGIGGETFNIATMTAIVKYFSGRNLAFAVGAILPLVAILLPPESLRIPVAFVAVLLGLLVTGVLSAQLGGSPKRVAAVRLVAGGALAMLVTFGIGALLGSAVS